MNPIDAMREREAFKSWYGELVEKAGQRIDRDAARYMYDQKVPIMDAVVKLVSR